MTERNVTTPFGGGRFSAALCQAEQAFLARRDALKGEKSQSKNFSGTVDKWQLLRALTEARAAYALSDRTIAVFEALLSFHPEKDLDGTRDLIVFPSNQELSIRCRGMSAPTLRRHIACLVKTGLLLRRDSANGKRFARKGPDGLVEDAFGFNLAPAALMGSEIFQHAEDARSLALAIRKIRGEITLHLRDISKMIEAAHEDGHALREPALWTGFIEDLRLLSGKVSRSAALPEHQARCEKLVRLRAEVERAFLDGMKDEDLMAADVAEEQAQQGPHNYSDKEMSGKDAQNERHIHNSNKETSHEYKQRDFEAGEVPHEAVQPVDRPRQDHEAAKSEAEQVSLSDLKQSCPEFTHYAVNGLATWRDAREAADLARPMLGISKDAWSRAQTVMGLAGSIVTIAYLVERAAEIKSSGGYLRALTLKAEAGKFRIRPMLESLKNRS